GDIGTVLRLENSAAKKLSGRSIPLRAAVRESLIAYHSTLNSKPGRDEPIIRSERGGSIKPQSIVNWFRARFMELGLTGASSHSGRRHFVTMAARRIVEVGGSLRDVQELAGHKALSTTQLYIAQNSDAQ